MTDCYPDNEWSYDNQEAWGCSYPLNSSLQTSPISILTKCASYPPFTEFSLVYDNGNQLSTFKNSNHDLRFVFQNTDNILTLKDATTSAILNNIHFHCPARIP